MSAPGLWRTILSSLLRHPFCGLMWVLCYAISKIEFVLRLDFETYERGFFWTKSRPIKISAKDVTGAKVPENSRRGGKEV